MGAKVSGLSQTKASPQVTEVHSTDQWMTCYISMNSLELVFFFMSAWSGPCKSMEAYVNELAAKYPEVEFIKTNICEIPAAVDGFPRVEEMPTFILTYAGQEIDRVVGAKEEELQTKILKHGSEIHASRCFNTHH